APSTTPIYTLPLHDALPIFTAKTLRDTLARHRALVLDLYYRECRELAAHLSQSASRVGVSDELTSKTGLYATHFPQAFHKVPARSEEHTSELQSRENLVCRL